MLVFYRASSRGRRADDVKIWREKKSFRNAEVCADLLACFKLLKKDSVRVGAGYYSL
jgi:hypothetical protein